MRLIILCAVIAFARAASLQSDRDARILSNDYTIDEKGNYKYSFSTSNGITREETGTVVNEGQPSQHILIEGQFSYINSEGKEEIVRYIGDENGYRILTQDSQIPEDYSFNAEPGYIVASLLGK